MMSRLPIAQSAELPEGSGIRFRARRNGREVEAFAIRFEGEVRAFVNACTHRAVELDLGRGEFFHPNGKLLLCRAHGAMFDPVTGACAGGMCARSTALQSLHVVEEGGWIYVMEGENG